MSAYTQRLEQIRKKHVEIVKDHKAGLSYTELSRKYNMSVPGIYQILRKYKQTPIYGLTKEAKKILKENTGGK